MRMLSHFGKSNPGKPPGDVIKVIKVRKRKKSLLDYFRCLSCKCRKGDTENQVSVCTPRIITSRPLGIPWDADDNVRRHVVEIKRARKFSADVTSCLRDWNKSGLRAPRLERQFSASLPDLRVNPCSVQAKPILKHRNSDLQLLNRNKIKKHARFSEEVDVFLCEANKVIKDQLKKEAEPLRTNHDSSPASRDIINATRAQKVFKLDSVEIERGVTGRRWLRVVIHVGDSGVRERVTVCSSRGGTRLVLTASRSEPLGDGTFYRRQLADRFRLPHPIDPCSLRARVSPYGDLVIQAAMFDFDLDDERS